MDVTKTLDPTLEGGRAASRPLIDILVEDLHAGRTEGVLSFSFGTLANGLDELSEFSGSIFEAGGWIVLADGSLDTRGGHSTFSVLLNSLKHWTTRPAQAQPGQGESSLLPSRIRSPAPFGYRWMNAFLEPHPIAATACRKIFESFAELGDQKLVAARLNLLGYRARDRRRLTGKHVRSVILNPASKGVYRGNRKPSSWDFPASDAPPFIRIEPIVDEHLWNRCNAILSEAG